MIEGAPLFVGAGIVILGLGVPLWLRKVRPNRLYEVRTSVTLRDKRSWYEVNATTGRDMVVVGILTLVFAFVFPAWGISGDVYSLLMAGIVIVCAVFVSIAGLSRSRGFRNKT